MMNPAHIFLNNPTVNMSKRKRSSYDAAFKLKVVLHAEESGSNRKTAEYFQWYQ